MAQPPGRRTARTSLWRPPPWVRGCLWRPPPWVSGWAAAFEG